MKYLITLSLLFIMQTVLGQSLTGTELLDKAIHYHDPQNNWASFQGEFKVVLETPDNPQRESVITLDLPKEYFNVSTLRDGKSSFREIQKGNCRFSTEDATVKQAALDQEGCERTLMFRNYYTYLYGLPMKLKDPGTHILPDVAMKMFKGKEYLVLRVTYDDSVGTDVWQFYFNPETYAMEVYQFFKGGDEKTGEYILLSEEVMVNDIKMPKDRAWYYNKNDGYLGTDKLVDQN